MHFIETFISPIICNKNEKNMATLLQLVKLVNVKVHKKNYHASGVEKQG